MKLSPQVLNLPLHQILSSSLKPYFTSQLNYTTHQKGPQHKIRKKEQRQQKISDKYKKLSVFNLLQAKKPRQSAISSNFVKNQVMDNMIDQKHYQNKFCKNFDHILPTLHQRYSADYVKYRMLAEKYNKQCIKCISKKQKQSIQLPNLQISLKSLSTSLFTQNFVENTLDIVKDDYKLRSNFHKKHQYISNSEQINSFQAELKLKTLSFLCELQNQFIQQPCNSLNYHNITPNKTQSSFERQSYYNQLSLSFQSIIKTQCLAQIQDVSKQALFSQNKIIQTILTKLLIDKTKGKQIYYIQNKCKQEKHKMYHNHISKLIASTSIKNVIRYKKNNKTVSNQSQNLKQQILSNMHPAKKHQTSSNIIKFTKIKQFSYNSEYKSIQNSTAYKNNQKKRKKTVNLFQEKKQQLNSYMEQRSKVEVNPVNFESYSYKKNPKLSKNRRISTINYQQSYKKIIIPQQQHNQRQMYPLKILNMCIVSENVCYINYKISQIKLKELSIRFLSDRKKYRTNYARISVSMQGLNEINSAEKFKALKALKILNCLGAEVTFTKQELYHRNNTIQHEGLILGASVIIGQSISCIYKLYQQFLKINV